MTDELHNDLARGARTLGLTPDEGQLDALLQLIGLLRKWNKAYNLTAITAAPDILRKHLLDSLSVLPFVAGPRIVDVGTGAGFPGLPIAIMRPDWSLTLLDSHAKKLRFIDHVAAELKLDNVTTLHSRVEDSEAGAGFDTVICRAFTSLPRFVELAGHLLADGGKAVAMKGRADTESGDTLSEPWQVEMTRVVVPLLADERHVFEIRRR